NVLRSARAPGGSASTSACDGADACDGSGTCGPNHAADGSACGDAGTACVNQDMCASGSCQDNGFAVSGTSCGDGSDTECDDPDSCDGTGGCQANHAPG